MKAFNHAYILLTVLMCASNAAVLKACNVPGPVSYYGKMQVVGNRIYGSHNHAPVQVKGISFYWSIWKGEEFYNAGAVDALVDGWKVEIIRIPMSVETDEKRQGGNYGYLNPEGRERQIALVERLVDAAIARDIYVIIDYHSHNAHLHTQNAKEFFGYMAKKYGGYDNVIFEIYNEPITPDWQTIKKYAVSVIDTIRVYSDNLVIVGTENYSQRVDIASLSPLEDSNVAYVFHFYATHEDQERDYVTKALNNNVALFASEWGNAYVAGEKNGKTDVKAFENSDKWHVLLDSNMISSANWSIYSRDIAPSNAELSLFGPATGTVSRTGKGWSDTTNMTASGLYVYKMLRRHASNALWRK